MESPISIADWSGPFTLLPALPEDESESDEKGLVDEQSWWGVNKMAPCSIA